MSRKPKIPTDGAPALSSNPFAALGGALGDLPPGAPVSTPPDEAPEPTDVSAPALRAKIVVRREKKGRGGKAVTVIDGLRSSPEVLADLAQQLRRSLGCGAHVEGETIVLTGAQTDRVHDWLSAQGATRIVIGN
jgi:translation initiation factor 1